MSGKGKVSRMKTTSRSMKAGLMFPVGRIARLLKDGKYANRISNGAPVYLAGVLESLAAKVLGLAGKAADDHKKIRILPRHIQLAILDNDELSVLLGQVTISGSVNPNIQTALLPEQTGNGKPAKAQPSV